MIKIETLGMLNVAKNNPNIVLDTATKNYSFVTYDGELYLIANTVVGDDSYLKDVTIPAGEYLRGFRVKDWEGQNLVVDLAHVKGDAPVKGDTLVVDTDGGLKAGSASGVHFVVVDAATILTGDAVKVKVCVADEDEEADPEDG